MDNYCDFLFSDDEMTKLFQEAIINEYEKSKSTGIPFCRYDITKKSVYLEYADGHIEYQK